MEDVRSVLRGLKVPTKSPFSKESKFDLGLPRAIISDVDKTVLYPSTHDFPAPEYFLNKCAWNIIKTFQNEGYKLLFLTCRPESMREETQEELSKYFGNFKLFMREGNTQLKDDTDDVIKEKIFLKEIKPFYNVRYVMDDKGKILDMFKKYSVESLGFYMDLER